MSVDVTWSVAEQRQPTDTVAGVTFNCIPQRPCNIISMVYISMVSPVSLATTVDHRGAHPDVLVTIRVVPPLHVGDSSSSSTSFRGVCYLCRCGQRSSTAFLLDRWDHRALPALGSRASFNNDRQTESGSNHSGFTDVSRTSYTKECSCT